jgi:hypothetical protein
MILFPALIPQYNHHNQPINVLTAVAQVFLMDLLTRRTGHNQGPVRYWWVLMTATTGTTGSLPKHGGAQNSKFLVTYPMTDQCCLASAILR